MSEPPQRLTPPIMMYACHGISPWETAVPLMMRDDGFTYSFPAFSWIGFWAQFSRTDGDLELSNEEKIQHLLLGTILLSVFPSSREN
ncbi:hypothetical protein PR048_005225 [Dryococelus australis]|uniref:Uncharacterized protein n=1 Tax=Dryococelus australis TaxID=614101 RepID=A0ABQ9I8N2_9NEOP|nr:hypothetical protein PR048_005225 [Dryococelus australis]